MRRRFLLPAATPAQTEIVALRHSYCMGVQPCAMAMTGQDSWRIGPPMPNGIVYAHNAYCYCCPFGLEYPSCELRCAKRHGGKWIRTTTSGRVAGMIAEPIQGVGGFITPPKEYFPIVAGKSFATTAAFTLAMRFRTAWGRTGGKWFGIEQWGVTPDIITSAKGLGNGMPIGLTVAWPEIADSLKGITISTFGGNLVTNTAARAVIDFIEEHALVANTETMGHYSARQVEGTSRINTSSSAMSVAWA